LAAATLVAFVPNCFPQVLSPPEILDPAMRALQQKHFPELKAAAVDITSHRYPYRFYLSSRLDPTQQQEQQSDQRSIRLMLEAGLKLNGFRVTSVVLRKNCIRPAPRRF
jgi:hypothetical protein